MTTLQASRFANERDNAPQIISGTWLELTELLRHPRRTPCSISSCTLRDCEHKAGPAWSPAIYPRGAARKKELVGYVSALVLDVDHQPADVLAGVADKVAPYSSITHSSHSDRPDDRCVRIVVALSRPVAGADWHRFWHAAVALLGIPVDPSTKDASRLYYLPSRPHDAFYAFQATEGASLDVDTILATAPEVYTPTVHTSPTQLGSTPIAEGGRNNALFKLGAALRATGIDLDALRAALTFENARRFTPPLPDSEVDQVARSVVTRVHPERDVAAGAVVEADMRALFPQPPAPHGNVYTATELVDTLMVQASLPVVPLPFQKLNDKIGGLSIHSSTLIVAGTGKGKSSLAGQLAAWHAATQGPAVIYVGEMTPELYLGRIAGQLLGRSWIDVTRGKLTAVEIKRALADRPLYLVRRNDNPVRSMLEACSRAHHDGHTGVPMVVVDYMQLLAHASADMRTSTMQAVRDVRAMLEDTDMVGLLLSQTSRGNAKRIREGEGNAEDLGDVGAETAELEQSATNQFVLSFVSKDDAEVHEVTLAVTKSRFGGGAKFGFTFNGKTGLWASTDRPPSNAQHEARCETILAQLRTHRDRACVGGGGSCGKEFTTNTLVTKGPHKIAGRTESVIEAVQDLVTLRKVMKLGNLLMLPEGV